MHRILVVEDSADLREILNTVLTNAGFEVALAESNSEAMTIVQNFVPDLVLADCFLSGAGPIAIAVLKQSRPSLPVIVLSGDPERARQMLPDADAVLGKPISLAQVLQTVIHFVEAHKADRRSGGADS
jgi:CheY-like chemotaxis protein